MGDTAIHWTNIPNWPGFLVSDDGRVRGLSGKILKPSVSRDGHLYINHRWLGKQEKLWIHRAVLEAFVGPCPSGQEARHLDGNPSQNTLDNLAWGTRQENADDRVRHGNSPKGERSGLAKLTEKQVIEIRDLYGTRTLRALARQYGVSHTAIRRTALGIKWSYLNA